jgi:hypothetical protein
MESDLVKSDVHKTLQPIVSSYNKKKKAKAVPLHTTEALGWRGDIVHTHS